MRFRLQSITQKKCNLCLQWMVLEGNHKSKLNICNKCLEQSLEFGQTIQDSKGQTYEVIIRKESQNKTIIDNLKENTQNQKQIIPRFSQLFVKSFLKNKQISSEEQNIIQSKMQQFNKQFEHQAQNLLSFIKGFSNTTNTESQIFEDPVFKRSEKYKSCIFDLSKNQQSNFKKHAYTNKKQNRLEDMCGLNETRYIPGYDFYFQPEILKDYIDSKKQVKPERVFGNELNLNTQKLFLNLKQRKNSRIKSIITINSNDVHSLRSLRLSQQALKFKISSYLESKYQSISLQRIMGRYVKQAYQNTNILQKTIQLVSFRITQMDIHCYLNLFDFQNVQSVKLINVGLTDSQLQTILEHIWNKNIESLVLTGNKLTQNGLSFFLNKSLPFLREIYLGKNRISKYKAKQNLIELRGKFTVYV